MICYSMSWISRVMFAFSPRPEIVGREAGQGDILFPEAADTKTPDLTLASHQ